MKITMFGLAITSSWGNGHATTFRALCKALHKRGHRITFFERDVEWYASNRDLPEPEFCEVVLYRSWKEVLEKVRVVLRESDVAIVGSYFPDGVQAIDEMLDCDHLVKAFYDIDTPITVSQLNEQGSTDYLLAEQIPSLDLYLSFTGGPTLRELESKFNAKRAAPLYCSFDPERYQPLPSKKDFECDLGYMGTYAPDRQRKLEQFLCMPASRLPEKKFIVAGPQYPAEIEWPANVQRISHLEPRYHSLLYSSSKLTLNLTRRDMVMAGYSPSVRLFEAAACGATIVSDNWPGLDDFFVPGKEILLPSSAEDVERYLVEYSPKELEEIGMAARERVMLQHTNELRAQELEQEVERARTTAATTTQ